MVQKREELNFTVKARKSLPFGRPILGELRKALGGNESKRLRTLPSQSLATLRSRR